jgi:hypothetical protein
MGYNWSEMYHSSGTLAALTLIIIILELLKNLTKKTCEEKY